MKSIISLLLLASSTSSLKLSAGPDIYGPNGEGYVNNSASYDNS